MPATRGAPETVAEEPEGIWNNPTTTIPAPQEEAAERRSWWRRMFGG